MFAKGKRLELWNDKVPAARETILADSHNTKSVLKSLITLYIPVLEAPESRFHLYELSLTRISRSQ